MSLVARILTLVASIVFVVMLTLGYYGIKLLQETTQHQFEQLKSSYLTLADSKFETHVESLMHSTDVIAQNPDIQKSLDLQVSRGINQRLNKLVSLYPNLNYLLVVDTRLNVFAANTIDGSGHRINSEQLLGLSINDNPLFYAPSLTHSVAGTPNIDPFALSDRDNKRSQWIISPVIKRGNIIGWIVLSFSWQEQMQEILDELTEKLAAQNPSIIGTVLVDDKNELIVATKGLQTQGSISIASLSTSDTIVLKHPVTFNRLKGNILLVTDKHKATVIINDAKKILFNGLVTGTFILIILLFITLRKTLFKKIDILIQGTQQLKKGNYQYQVPSLGKNELGNLSDAFNQLAINLHDSRQQLLNEKDSLDIKVKERTKQLEHAMIQAEASTKAKSEFLAAMSHEIRTPMNGVLGMAQLLQSTDLHTQQQEYLNILYNSGRSLLNIINDILDFSKVEAGKMDLDYISFDLERATYDICQLLAVQSQKKDVELILSYSPDCHRQVEGDAGRIRQLLTNLISNAIKFTHNGHVIINIEQKTEATGRSYHYIEVIDTGIGISEQAQPTLFSSFTQADSSTTRKYGGTGLGLAICKKITELMHGEIGVHSVAGEGSTFWIKLPLKLLPSPKPLPKAELKGIRALIIDDNKTQLQIISDMLNSFEIDEEHCTKQDLTIDTLEHAIEKKNPYDVLIIDHQPPRLDCVEIAKQVRKNQRFRNLPIIALSSSCQKGDGKRLKEAGINSLVNKPILTETLKKTLMSTLGIMQQFDERTFVTSHDIHESERLLQNKFPKLTGHILLAEDVLANQLVAKNMLEKLGLTLELATDGQIAVNMSQEKEFDLILMDCQMPNLDGYQATRKIRASSKNENTPIIALTANALNEDKEKCLSSGMNDFLAKPFEQRHFNQMLQQWLHQNEEERALP